MAAPKVLIREVQSGTNTIVGVGTSVAGFVGLADKGPIGQAQLVSSFEQYTQEYGDFRSDSYLSHAVLGFFQNGGQSCFVVRTGHYSNLANGILEVTENAKSTVTIVDRNESASILQVDALSEGDHGNDLAIKISRASNESSSFNKVFGSDAGVYTDNTSAARSAALFKAMVDDGGSFSDSTVAAATAGGGTPFNALSAAPAIDDALYIGAKERTFDSMYFGISTPATTAGVAQLEYWNGSSWQSLSPTTDQITSGGITFGAAVNANALVQFSVPADWKRVSINSSLGYWVRYKVTTAFSGTAPQINRVSLSEDKPFGAFTAVASNVTETAAATAVNDVMYLGSNSPFKYAVLSLLTPGDSSGIVAWEYWNGQSWSALQNITQTVANAQHLRASGTVGWDSPSDWRKTSINSSSSFYFVRARITTDYSSAYPSLDHALPASDLFKLSVLLSGTEVESFDNVQVEDSSLASYAESINSAHVAVSVLANATTAPNNRPIEVVSASLSGGLYVTSSVNDNDYVGSEASLSGLEALPDEVNVVVIPGIRTEAVYNGMLSHCERQADRMAILEAPGDSSTDTPLELVELVRDEAALNSSYGAIYDYWILVPDPVTGIRIAVPPSGHLAGMYARVDEARGVWKAPAGVQDGRLFGALGVVRKTSQAERDLMYDNKINPIRDQAGFGVYVDGSITLAPLGTDFDRVSVRRLFLFVEESLQDASEVYKHEPIDSKLFDKMRSSYSSFLLDLWRKGGLRGTKASDAFFVIVNDSNNPPSSVNKRQVNVKIGLAALQPAEMIVLEFTVDKRALNAELASQGLV